MHARAAHPPFVGRYGCHGHGDQRWSLGRDGVLSSDMLCLMVKPPPVAASSAAAAAPTPTVIGCNAVGRASAADREEFKWRFRPDESDGGTAAGRLGTLSPAADPGSCLDRGEAGGGGHPALLPCQAARQGQQWVFTLKKGSK